MMNGTLLLAVGTSDERRAALERAGAVVRAAADDASALARLAGTRSLLVDGRQCGVEGIETLRRATTAPILVVCATGDETGRAAALRAGADDVVPPDVGHDELVARMAALVRRGGAAGAQRPESREVLADALVEVDVDDARVRVGGAPVALSPRELRMLAALVRHRGQVLSVEQLSEQVWGQPAAAGRDQVKACVVALRRKLAAASPGAGQAIAAVRGAGYRYTPPARAA